MRQSRDIVVSMETGVVRSMNNTAPLGGITSRLNVVFIPNADFKVSSLVSWS